MKRTFLVLPLFLASVLANAQQKQEMGLEDIFALADQNSQQIRICETDLEAFDEAIKSAKSNKLPDVDLSLSGYYIGNANVLSRDFSSSGTTTVAYAIGAGEIENGTQSSPHWGNNFMVKVSQVIYAGGAISSGIRMAELGKKMSELNMEKNRQEVRFALTGQYLELCKLNNQLEVIEKNIELTEKVLKTMNARQEQGTALKTDIIRYELQLKSLQLSETKLRDAVSIVSNHLAVTLHMPEGTIITPKQDLSAVDKQEQSYWQNAANENNISLQQAQLQADMKSEEVKIARSEKRPKVAAFAQDQFVGPYVNDLIPVDANVNSWFIGLGINYNLGSLWRNNHSVKKAEIISRESQEQVQLANEGIIKAVQAEYVNLQTSYIEVETQQKQVELANQHYDVTQNRYGNGLALLTDMLDASNMKLSADMSLVNARIDLIFNYYKLKYITSSL